MFYLNFTLHFGIPPLLVFQLEVYYKVDRFLTGLTAQQLLDGIQISGTLCKIFVRVVYMFSNYLMNTLLVE